MGIPLDWRWLANGYLDELLYEKGIVNRDMPFAELKKRSYINPKAQAVAPGGRLLGRDSPGIAATAAPACHLSLPLRQGYDARDTGAAYDGRMAILFG